MNQKPKRQEVFAYRTAFLSRGECLRELIASIYRAAKKRAVFTTDDVFKEVISYDQLTFRKSVASSKLIAVALQKARRAEMCYLGPFSLAHGDETCHGRKKGQWVSKLFDGKPTMFTTNSETIA